MHKHASLFLVLASLPLAALGCGGSTSQQSNSQESNDGGNEEGSVMRDAGKDTGGGGMDAGHDSGPMQQCMPMNGMLSPGYPAMHGAMPQVGYQGGGVLVNPEIVTVTFPGDTMAQQLEGFDDGILQTCWWDTVRAGYCEGNGMNCVGRGVVPMKPHVELTSAAASSYTDSSQGGASTIQTFIQQQVSNGTFPAPNANTVYTLYFPSGTSLTLDGAQSCVNGGFGGYHNSTTVTPPGGSNTVVSYAVVPRCTNTLAEITFAASHELSEASTDPHVGQNQIGYYMSQTNLDYLPWALLGGGEIGDLCVDPTGANQDQTTATLGTTTWTVQRIWSNANAAAGLDPCVPMPSSEIYFNVAPEAGHGTLMMGVGTSQTFTATAFSSGPMAAWQVQGLDLAQLQGQTPIVQVALTDSTGAALTTVKNGDTVNVKVTLASTPPNYPGTNIPAEPYFFVSAVSQQGPIHLWPMLVAAQ